MKTGRVFLVGAGPGDPALLTEQGRKCLEQADAVAAVLPPELLAKLLTLAGNKPVLRAVSERRATGCIRTLPDGRREQEFAYVHAGWEQLLRMDVRTRRL